MNGETEDREFKRLMIRGQVQKIGYRVWAERESLALGLKGWVRNRHDGTVELVISGATNLREKTAGRSAGCDAVPRAMFLPPRGHRFEDWPEGEAVARKRILHARRHLREGVALDDPLLLQRPQSQRQGPRADPLKRTLQLAEARATIGQVTNEQ